MAENLDETEIPPSAAAREHSKGRIDSRQPEEYPHAGLVGSDELRQLLDALVDHYDPHLIAEHYEEIEPMDLPPRAQDTKLYQKLLRRESTETLTRAIHAGDDPTVSYFTGVPDMQSDISGLSAITALEDQMAGTPVVYIWGHPGSGKTNFSLLLSQIWKNRVHGGDGEIGTNIRSWKEADRWIPSYGQLSQWLDEQIEEIEGGGSTQRKDVPPRLFVFDEASSHAAGHGKQGYETREKLAPMIYKARKAKAGLIIIGHDGKDVHPAIRALAICVKRYRDDQKRATIYQDVDNRTGRGRIMDIRGVPETDYRYDDKEATSWSWGSGAEDDLAEQHAEEIEQLAEELTETEIRRFAATLADSDSHSLTYEEIGTIIGESYRDEPFGSSWVGKWVRQLRKGEL